MLEDTVLYADAAGFGRSHEFLLAEREYLTAHKTRDPRPAEESEDEHQINYTERRIDALLIHRGAYDDYDGHRRDAVEDIDKTHDDIIDPAAEVSGDTSHDYSEEGLDEHYDESDKEGYTSAVHKSREHIHAVFIGAEPVSLAREGVAVILTRNLLLTDGPAGMVRLFLNQIFGSRTCFSFIGSVVGRDRALLFTFRLSFSTLFGIDDQRFVGVCEFASA